MNRRYTHIFFDLDNTLWDFNRNSREAIYQTFLKFKLNDFGLTFNEFFEVYSKHNELLWGQYRRKEIHKSELKSQRFQKTFDDFEILGIDPLQINDHYLKIMSNQTCLIEGAVNVLSALKTRNYRLFVITNGFSEVQHKKIERSGLASFFDRVFISEEVKAPKPDRKIFEYAITSANAKKSRSLMIGDDLEVDVKGALNVGLAAIFFNPRYIHNNEERNVSEGEFAVISKLTDLLQVL